MGIERAALNPPSFGLIIIKMKRRTWLFSIILLSVLLGVTFYLWSTPYVLDYTPNAEQQEAPASAILRIRFSRRMDADGIRSRLHIEPAIVGELTWQANELIFSPRQPWPGGGVVQVRLDGGGRAASWPRLGMARGLEWSFKVRAPRLAYLYPSDGPANLYLLDLASGESQQLTNSAGGVFDFVLTAAGDALYYASSLGDEGSQISRLELEGQGERQVVNCPNITCRNVQVSPDGNRLAYERSTSPDPGQASLTQVWLHPLDGSPAIRLGAESQRTEQPSWSSDGWLAYYNFDESTYIFLEPAGGASTRTASPSGISGGWSHDGSSYIFVELFSDAISPSPVITGLISIPSSHLLKYYPTDGNLQDLTRSGNYEDATPVFSPDGEHIAFARKRLDLANWTTGRQLWLMRPDGTQDRPLTNEPLYTHYDFAWSPDSRQLAYVRFNEDTLTEPPEIWLTDVDGSKATRLLVGGYAPAWAP
jgi:Tol biopolymer transport system component